MRFVEHTYRKLLKKQPKLLERFKLQKEVDNYPVVVKVNLEQDFKYGRNVINKVNENIYG
jgi:hypothetical protein